MDVKWIKIVTDVFDDEKILLIESMPDADAVIVIWFKLLCLAGKMNNHGVFILSDRIPYTEEMLATIFRRPLNTVRMAIQTFTQFGMIEVINGVITIPNWEKHQSLDRLEERKEYMKGYMREYREKQKLLCESTEESTECKVNSKVNSKVYVSSLEEDKEEDKKENKNKSNTDADFEAFWNAYPRHRGGKEAALKAFKKVKVPIETLIKAVEQQKLSEQWTHDNGKYIPYPATWLNQGRWEDEVEQVNPCKNRNIDVADLPEIRRPKRSTDE